MKNSSAKKAINLLNAAKLKNRRRNTPETGQLIARKAYMNEADRIDNDRYKCCLGKSGKA